MQLNQQKTVFVILSKKIVSYQLDISAQLKLHKLRVEKLFSINLTAEYSSE